MAAWPSYGRKMEDTKDIGIGMFYLVSIFLQRISYPKLNLNF
jgi:hypothetical protein